MKFQLAMRPIGPGLIGSLNLRQGLLTLEFPLSGGQAGPQLHHHGFSAAGATTLAHRRIRLLRRYLTSTPLGQRTGYETARRVLVMLRLTGWISLVGQHRAPLTGHVLSELYQLHESALHFQQACMLDASLLALLQASIGHENNQVDRVVFTFRQCWRKRRKLLPLRPTINSAMTMICPDTTVSGE